MSPSCQCDLIIIGGGPAGMAPVLRAARLGQLDQLLKAGVMIIESDEVFCPSSYLLSLTSGLSFNYRLSPEG